MGARMGETLTLSEFNVSAWAEGDYVREYSGHALASVEAALYARHRAALTGAVLEIGCGPGRITRVLAALSDEVIALDVSPRMVEACARNVPGVRAEVGDLRDLSAYGDGAFGAVVASNNVLDVLGDADRRAALAGFARVLAPGGTLLFSSHNQANIPHTRALPRTPREFAAAVYHSRHLPQRLRNRRFARAYEHSESDYAIVNDAVHDHRLAHYYIRRDAQERQLAEAGLELVDCLDVDTHPVARGETAERSSALHYAARRS
jgi:SAM-dependent methyltransferase